jgi:hypothetical protein
MIWCEGTALLRPSARIGSHKTQYDEMLCMRKLYRYKSCYEIKMSERKAGVQI